MGKLIPRPPGTPGPNSWQAHEVTPSVPTAFLSPAGLNPELPVIRVQTKAGYPYVPVSKVCTLPFPGKSTLKFRISGLTCKPLGFAQNLILIFITVSTKNCVKTRSQGTFSTRK